MHYDDSYSDNSRITISSILLLVIFVSAAALILAAVIWRPWFGDSDKASNIQAPAAEEVADDAEVAAEGDVILDDTAGDETEAEPVAAQ